MPSSSGILLVGAGGHCRSVIDVLERAGLPVAGIVYADGSQAPPVSGYPVAGYDSDLKALRARHAAALVTVGQIEAPHVREKLFTLLTQLNYSLPVVVSPLAYVSKRAEIRAGSIAMHHAIINCNASVGRNSIINTRSLIEHDCLVGDNCHIAVGATLCGGVQIGNGSFIGAGAIVREGVSIGAGCVVGMGCIVRRDLKAGERYVG